MRRFAIIAACAFAVSQCGGCFGYVLGWSDKEVRRIRQVVAELEARNAELLEENLSLRREIEEMKERLPVDSAERSTEDGVSRPGG